MREKRIVRDCTPGWRDSRSVCALSDEHRHLGHIVRYAGHWSAFDATHLDDNRSGFHYLGAFADIDLAKAAVVSAVACDDDRSKFRPDTAGTGFSPLWVS